MMRIAAGTVEVARKELPLEALSVESQVRIMIDRARAAGKQGGNAERLELNKSTITSIKQLYQQLRVRYHSLDPRFNATRLWASRHSANNGSRGVAIKCMVRR